MWLEVALESREPSTRLCWRAGPAPHPLAVVHSSSSLFLHLHPVRLPVARSYISGSLVRRSGGLALVDCEDAFEACTTATATANGGGPRSKAQKLKIARRSSQFTPRLVCRAWPVLLQRPPLPGAAHLSLLRRERPNEESYFVSTEEKALNFASAFLLTRGADRELLKEFDKCLNCGYFLERKLGREIGQGNEIEAFE